MVTESQKTEIRKLYIKGNDEISDKLREVNSLIDEGEYKVSSFMNAGDLQEPFNDTTLNNRRQLIEQKKVKWDRLKSIMESTIVLSTADGSKILNEWKTALKDLRKELSQMK